MPPYPCPTCNRTLSTERGMRQHHTKVHDEPLPNRTCSECGEEFYDPKARRTYCDDCYTGTGEQNGNWKDAKAVATCRRCGDDFEYYPSDKEGVFCPECVADAEEFLGTPSYEGKLTEKVTTLCEQCGDEVTLRRSKRNYGAGRFCSRECLAQWQSENWQGEDHPNWNGGWNEFRVNGWSKARRDALARDNHRCQSCGVSASELDQEPDVHHIVPVRTFADPDTAHALENLITLCRSCHMKVEHGEISAQGRE
jgi:hypothetical protein